MLSRRDLIAGGVASGLAGGRPSAAEASQELDAPTRAAIRDIAAHVDGIEEGLERALLGNSLSFGVVADIRQQMIAFCRAHQKFPDFMEVGLGVFVELYDWHVKHRQPLVLSRGPDGRYWLQFMFTHMVLRPEVDSGFIGVPYDRA
jgi:hypothetical protein